jgi:glycine/D-amino acid oxidase-like deaminating enzyme/nitrite reductase/ring-hydroxylating ferredoxin subunit
MEFLNHGESISLWSKINKENNFSSLKENLKVDVCVIGGGMAGLCTAYHLLKEGKKVCVLENFNLASGQTAKTTAQLSYVLGERFFKLKKYHGKEGIKLIIDSHMAAINRVEEIARTENIDCDLERVNGYLFSEDNKILRDELTTIKEAGFNDVELRSTTPLNSFEATACLCFPQQLQFHPLKFLNGLIDCITNLGGKFFTHTHVKNIEDGNPARVTTEHDYIITCDAVVVATNTPFNDRFTIHTKQAPYRSYVLGFKIPKGSIEKGLFWDTLEPYHYIRTVSQLDHDILLVGGEDHKTGQEDNPQLCFSRLESWTRARFSKASDIQYRWSGQVMEPIDGIAHLGHNPMDKDNVYIITGDAGNGMTHSMIGAILITDQIMGRANPWVNLYNPSRLTLMATKTFVQENANVAVQYAQWLEPKLIPDLDNVPRDQGIVFRDGMQMIAAYQELSGNWIYLSAACPHLAGIVKWNNVEKSWDCPCHGSRFDCHGKVIEGPAFTDLKRIDTFHPINIEKVPHLPLPADPFLF